MFYKSVFSTKEAQTFSLCDCLRLFKIVCQSTSKQAKVTNDTNSILIELISGQNKENT
jgi:hypothetical protein